MMNFQVAVSMREWGKKNISIKPIVIPLPSGGGISNFENGGEKTIKTTCRIFSSDSLHLASIKEHRG